MTQAIRSFWQKIGNAIIESRKQRAAEEMARHLVMYNPDFRNVSQIDLMNAIKSEKPIKISEIGH